MAGTEPPRYVELTGDLPPGVQAICARFLGLYKRQQNDVNGKASYGKVGDADSSLWISPGSVGYIAGTTREIGTAKGFLTRYGSDLSGNSVWRATRASDWVDAPNLRAIALTAADDDEVTVVATSTPAARNAEKRKHALDLELFEPKRARTPSLELETSVAKRRSTLTPDVDKKVLELVQPAIQEWVENKIDEAELKARKAAARTAAEAEDARLSALDAAHAKYTAAVAARVAAEESIEKLRPDEDAAEAELRKLLPAEAGPSGVVKGEA